LGIGGEITVRFNMACSMIVDDLDLLCLAVPSEDDAILIVDSNAPFAG
jgi:hypothetical protein